MRKTFIIGENDLATVRPDLAQEWHPSKNGDLLPSLVTCGNNKKVWWKCVNGHEWEAVISDRVRGNGCPFCSGRRAIKGKNDLATVNPELAEEWNYDKNGDLRPSEVSYGSDKKVWWKCSKGHEWDAVISSRRNGHGCPFCSGKRALKGETDLATVRPDLAEEWNYGKNGELTPYDITSGSSKKVWWKCKFGHEWEANINSRNKGSGCPFCSGKRVLKGVNDLATLRPDLAEEWDYEKNGGIMPYDVARSTKKKVWWKCLECGNEYQALINSRALKNVGCPICNKDNAKIHLHDYYMQKNGSLEDNYPDIAKEWHPTKNGSLKPTDVTASTDKKVWWLGGCGHEWQASISHRVPHENAKGTGCPYCLNRKVLSGFNDLQTKMPDLSQEWNHEKNGGLMPYEVTYGSNKTVWWKCKYGHEWKAKISDRVRGNGCPKCSSQGTSLPEQGVAFYLEKVCKVEQRIKIVKQEIDVFLSEYNIGIEYDGSFFHPSERQNKENEKNQKLKDNGVILIRIKESDHNSVDSNIIFFKVDYLGQNYEWALKQLCHLLVSLTGNEQFDLISIDTQRDLLKIRERVNLFLKENSVSVMYPNLAEEWHPTKNGTLTPEMFSVGANTKVWWQCSKGHEWQALINGRAKGNGCPFCSGKYIIKGETDLSTLNPDLAKEWNYEKNGDLKPSDISCSSNKKVWWKCSEGHEWQVAPNSRTSQNTGCPYCSGRIVLKGFNDLATIRPDIAKEWNYEKNGDLMPSDVTRGANKKVWWKCLECGNEYQAVIGNRTVLGRGCPKCGREKQVSSQIRNLIAKNGSLEENFPTIAIEWHPTKNGSLKPADVTCATNKRIWWQCKECGHEWQTSVNNRTSKGTGCPICANNQKKLIHREATNHRILSEANPELVKEWNYEKNGDLKPTEVYNRSDLRVWWKCSKGHEWQTKIESRVQAKTGCPYCSDKAHKKVVCIETGCVFDSLSEASEKTFGNLKNVTNISNVCKGKREKAGGYHWKFFGEE